MLSLLDSKFGSNAPLSVSSDPSSTPCQLVSEVASSQANAEDSIGLSLRYSSGAKTYLSVSSGVISESADAELWRCTVLQQFGKDTTQRNVWSVQFQHSASQHFLGVHQEGGLFASEQPLSLRIHFTRATIVLIGAGNRGTIYSYYAEEKPHLCRIVAVADSKKYRRMSVASRLSLGANRLFNDFSSITALSRIADAAVIAVPDRLHVKVAVPFAKLGYHILLEKPMAVNKADCKSIVQAVKEQSLLLAVCHVMRYTTYSRAIKRIVDSGELGDIVSIQHLEPVGYFHFAHSYVRGNWRNEATSSFSLLAKSCHDIDWLRWMMGVKCTKVSSFGSLFHFKSENKPQGASSRCLDCAVEESCAYSAKKIYLAQIESGHTGWPVSVIVDSEPTVDNVQEALQKGPYGRCVFESDNDVMDNQVVNMEFEGGRTASFSMVAFSKEICVRKTRIFGTRGQLEGDGEKISVFDFLTTTIKEEIPLQDQKLDTKMVGHDYGDYYLMCDFINAVTHDDPSYIMSGPGETLESHLIVFDAEESRKSNTTISLEW